MPRPKPKSTIEDLMMFMVIGLLFSINSFGGMHPEVMLMFATVFFILAAFKLRSDKKACRPMGKAFFIFGISLAATTALAYAVADTYLMEQGY